MAGGDGDGDSTAVRVMHMHLSTVILPVYPWAEGRTIRRRAEALGFRTAYTYDHLSWQSFRDTTWFGTIPTLTAAAETLRIGTPRSRRNSCVSSCRT